MLAQNHAKNVDGVSEHPFQVFYICYSASDIEMGSWQSHLSR